MEKIQTGQTWAGLLKSRTFTTIIPIPPHPIPHKLTNRLKKLFFETSTTMVANNTNANRDDHPPPPAVAPLSYAQEKELLRQIKKREKAGTARMMVGRFFLGLFFGVVFWGCFLGLFLLGCFCWVVFVGLFLLGCFCWVVFVRLFFCFLLLNLADSPAR